MQIIADKKTLIAAQMWNDIKLNKLDLECIIFVNNLLEIRKGFVCENSLSCFD